MKSTRTLGMVLLGVWLIATGLLPFLTIRIPSSELLLSALAVVAGVLILMGR